MGRWLQHFSGLSLTSRLAIVLIVLSQLPLLYVLSNRLFLDYEFDASGYQHMHMIDRVLEGKPIYGDAAPDHAAVTYTPLYWWINAALFKVFGVSLVLPRFVSLAATAALVFFIMAFVWVNTEKNTVLTLAAPAMILATFAAEGMSLWVSAINVTSLYLALTVAGFYLLRDPLSTKKVVWAGVLFTLSVLDKQTGIAYVAAAGFMLFFKSRRHFTTFAIVVGVLLGISLLYLFSPVNGDFYKQTVTANKEGPPWMANRLLKEVLLGNFGAMFGIMIALTAFQVMSERLSTFIKSYFKPEYALCGAGIAAALIAHPKLGSGPSQDLLGFIGLAICGCTGVYAAARSLSESRADKLIAAIAVTQVAVVMMTSLVMVPFHRADEHDRAKHDRIGEIFRAGRTAIPHVPYIQKMFGQELWGYPGDELSSWRNGRRDFSGKPQSIMEPYLNQLFDYVIVVGLEQGDPLAQAIMQNYHQVGTLPPHPRGPVGGNLRPPLYVLEANRRTPQAPQQQP